MPVRLFDIQPVMAMEPFFQLFLQFVRTAPGNPSGQTGQGALSADPEHRRLGQRATEFDTQAGFVEARAVLAAQAFQHRAFGDVPFLDPLPFLAQPGARGSRMGPQFRGYRQFPPTGLGQQTANFVVAVARAGDDGIHLIGNRVEVVDDIAGHRQGFAHALDAGGGQAADIDRQQPVGPQQIGQVHVEVLQPAQGVLQGIQMANLFLDADLALIGGQAGIPYLLQPDVEFFQIDQGRRFGALGDAQRRKVATALDELGGPRFDFQPCFAVDRGRVFGELLRRVPGRAVNAETRQFERRIRGFGSEHVQADLDQRFGAKHQALPAAG